MKENMIKRNPLIPLMNEGLGELKCRRHFVLVSGMAVNGLGQDIG